MSAPVFFDDIKTGDELPPLTKGPLHATHVMRWSAATENWHPLHFDWKYATQHDGLPDVLVSGSWKQHVLIQLLTDWAGETGWLLRFKMQLRGMNVPGDTLTAWGRITKLEVRNGFGVADIEVGLRDQKDNEVAPGTATVVLPLRGGAEVPYPFDPHVLD